jgi:2'-5' RNA ligase
MDNIDNIKEYSIWLMPTGRIYTELNELIYDLGRRYNSPYFEPHVTLIGSIRGAEKDITTKTEKLASIIHPYEMELNKVSRLNEYFRCIFLKAILSDDVIKANSQARALFDQNNNQEYMPHLSLIYGNYNQNTKNKIISEIDRQIPLSFDVDKIHLFSTNGPVSEWYKVREFILQ